MKKLTIIVFMLVMMISSSCFALTKPTPERWVSLYTQYEYAPDIPQTRVWMDKDSVHLIHENNGTKLKAWVLMHDEVNEASVLMLWEFKPKTREYRIAHLNLYNSFNNYVNPVTLNKKDKKILKSLVSETFEPIPPDRMPETIFYEATKAYKSKK